ncbi:diguanylate cyclase [Thermogymnomonas acidicola]|uniref:Diguanylate cyclase n=1 Tax=Thermogymnomonas acidicola TaxID=399579 RepID=A0AA37BSB3_9ARCH|nr:ABC transporter permease [Thermogymnomonas acidicola]GGM77236.1 diguanylate cyclase [Thermogymnomonas acidicola]
MSEARVLGLVRRRREPGLKFEALRLFMHSPTGIAAIVILGIYVVLAAFGPYIAPYRPDQIDLAARILPPSPAHIMGTDEYGRDIFSRILYAIRLDLAIAFLSVTLGYALGVLIGLVSGYMGRITDNVAMRVMDILLAFPSILLAIAISIAIGQGFWTIVIAVTVVSLPGFARVSRSSVLSAKNELYVTAAVSIGASRAHIMLRHILPQTITPTIVLYALNLGNAILVAAGLSFLGVGIPPPTPELGAMVTEGLQFVVSGQWWVSVFPGLFIVFIVIAFNMLGDTIREVTDVTLRR